MDNIEQLLVSLRDPSNPGYRRAVAHALTLAEQGGAAGEQLAQAVFPLGGHALTIGFTGALGSGKSTLVDQVAAEFRCRGKRVAIIAVDPSSPFSHGAILGDRIRMQRHSGDDGVFIRSMAGRGAAGGLAPRLLEAIAVFDAAAWDVVLVETVGVGQGDTLVASVVDLTAVVLVPGLGDEIQTMKSGLLEVADLFVLNKADLGVERLHTEVTSMLELSTSLHTDSAVVPVLRTIALTGEGVPLLVEAIDTQRVSQLASGQWQRRQQRQWRQRLSSRMREWLWEQQLAPFLAAEEETMDQLASAIARRSLAPELAMEQLRNLWRRREV